MPNKSGNAYGLTTLCPLTNDCQKDESSAAIIRARLRALEVDENSPMAKVPNTYLCRLFVLDDVFYQGYPAHTEQLKSKYLVFVADIHGELRPYLQGMWQNAQPMIRQIWEFCIGFRQVQSGNDFVNYIEQCQVPTTFYFNGSNDEPLAEQLKALYIKQELSKFAYANQGKDAAALQRAFKEFMLRVAPSDLAGPTWRAGASVPATATTGART
jgi:hypothetical protein